MLSLTLEEYHRALECFQQALEEDPDLEEAQNQLLDLCPKLEEWELLKDLLNYRYERSEGLESF